MQFLLYLTPVGQEIYQLISKKVKVVENAPICKKYEIYGWFDSNKKTMTFCTNKILSKGNVNYDVNETLYHESGHIAQACRVNFTNIDPLGIQPIFLSSRRINDVKVAMSISGSKVRKIEEEAFWLEDKPQKVVEYLKKYCF